MNWTEDNLNRLRTLWDEGKTCAQIALELGTSRGSITGKARRLNLSSRPNPVTDIGQRFQRLIDLIAFDCDNHLTIREAARRVGLAFADADHLWREFIDDFAWHPEVGAEIYP